MRYLLTLILLLTLLGCEEGMQIADDRHAPAPAGFTHTATLELEQPIHTRWVHVDFMPWGYAADHYNDKAVSAVYHVNTHGFYAIDYQGLTFYRWDFEGRIAETWTRERTGAPQNDNDRTSIIWLSDTHLYYWVHCFPNTGGAAWSTRFDTWVRDLRTGEDTLLKQGPSLQVYPLHPFLPTEAFYEIHEFPVISEDPKKANQPMLYLSGDTNFEGEIWEEMPYRWTHEHFELIREHERLYDGVAHLSANADYILTSLGKRNIVWTRDGYSQPQLTFKIPHHVYPVYGYGNGMFWWRLQINQIPFEDPRRDGAISQYKKHVQIGYTPPERISQ